jgi:hypothetical protein
MADLLQNQIAALLKKAQEAHHAYEKAELDGKYDEQWPAWYADFLLNNGLPALTGTTPDPDALAAFLERTSQQMKAEASQATWNDYTANKLLDTLT